VEEEDEYSVGSEPVNPFSNRGVGREYPIGQTHANQWEAGFKHTRVPRYLAT